MHLRRTASVALAVVVAVIAPACQSDDDGDGGGGTATGDGARATAVTIKDFEFDPATVEVDMGEVVFELANDGEATHTFTIDAPKVDEEIAAGEDGSVTVSLPNQGEVIFYCRFHRGQGMQGKIVING